MSKREIALPSSLSDFLKGVKSIAYAQQRIISDLENTSDTKSTLKLIGDLERIGMVLGRYDHFSKHLQGQIFLCFKTRWDSLPKAFVQGYSDVYGYIRERYGYLSGMADIYMNVWDTYYSGHYQLNLPEGIDPRRISTVKLYSASPYVRRGKMNSARWKVLVNDSLNTEQVRRKLRNPKKSIVRLSVSHGNNGKSGTQFVQETGDLRMFIGGAYKHIGFLDIHSSDSDVVSEVRRILKDARIYTVE